MGISWFSRAQPDQLGKISRVESGHEKISSGLRIPTRSFLCTSAGPHSHVFSQKTPLDRKSGGRTRIVGSGLLSDFTRDFDGEYPSTTLSSNRSYGVCRNTR
jgi:hypothetical protein